MELKVKGTHTPLTYLVEIYSYYGSWRADVYAPRIKKTLWGLLPDRLKYEHVYNTGSEVEIFKNSLHPEDCRNLAERAVLAYERYKLAWEEHHATVDVPQE